MAQKLVFANKNKTNTLTWLNTLSGSTEYTSSTHKFYHSVVFTNDGYIITHGKIYNGNDTIADLESLGIYAKSTTINGNSKTFYVDSATNTAGLSNMYAPTTAGSNGQIVMSTGSGAPSWKTVLLVLTTAVGTPSAGQVLGYSGSALQWVANPSYKLNINGTDLGTSGGTSLGTVYAPTTAGTPGLILQANSSGIPAWTSLSTSIASNLTNADTTVPTSYAVYQAIEAAKTLAMVFKGSVESYSELPANPTNGDVYKFSADDTTNDYKTGDLAIAVVSGNTTTWNKIPAGDETETFITVLNSSNTAVSGYNSAYGEVVLHDAALRNALAASATIAGNTTNTGLVSAALVAAYVASVAPGTVTSVAAGVGLTTASGSAITSSGTIKAKLSSETALTGDQVYSVGVDSSGNLAVSIPWTDTTHNFYVGGSTAKANAAISTSGTDVYLTTKLTSAASSANGTNMIGFHAGTGIGITCSNAGLVTITNSSPNVTTSMLVGASNSTSNAAVTTNGNLYLRLKEGSSYSNFNIIGAGATTVTSTGSGNITITSVNTWRPVYAYDLTNQALTGNSPALSDSTGTAALAFGSEFAYTEGDGTINAADVSEIHLAWAEVAADGTITYAI